MVEERLARAGRRQGIIFIVVAAVAVDVIILFLSSLDAFKRRLLSRAEADQQHRLVLASFSASVGSCCPFFT